MSKDNIFLYVYFTSKGAGDLYIKAECSLVSKTFAITDAVKYIPTAITSNTTLNIDLPTGDFEVSFKTKRTSGSNIASWITVTNGSRNTALCGVLGSNGVNALRIYTDSSNFNDYVPSATPVNVECTHIWRKQGNTSTYSMNSESGTVTDSQNHIQLTTATVQSNNRIYELLIKPL